jgi:hypothetical protein
MRRGIRRAATGAAALLVTGPLAGPDADASQQHPRPCGVAVVRGSAWLSGAGVDVHSNGTDQTTPRACAGTSTIRPSRQDGQGWQCVELAARLYAVKGWGQVLNANAGGRRVYGVTGRRLTGAYPGYVVRGFLHSRANDVPARSAMGNPGPART